MYKHVAGGNVIIDVDKCFSYKSDRTKNVLVHFTPNTLLAENNHSNCFNNTLSFKQCLHCDKQMEKSLCIFTET